VTRRRAQRACCLVVWSVPIALFAVTVGVRATPALDACSADDIVAQDPGCPSGTGTCSITKNFQVANGCVLDFGGRAVTISANASGPVLSAQSAAVTIQAGSLVIAPGGLIDGRGISTTAPGDQGGSITINTTGAVTLQKTTSAGRIDVSATTAAGTITINAGGSVTIAGALNADRLTNYPTGDGGTIQISAGGDIIGQAGSLISTYGGDQAPNGGGEVDLLATGKILLSGTIDIRGSDGGTLNAQAGDALSVDTVMGNGTGDGGSGANISIEAGTSIQVTNQITASGAISPTFSGGGAGGTVSLTADFGSLAVTASGGVHADGANPDGDAGEIDLTAQGAVLLQKGSTTVAHVSVSGGGPLGGGGLISIQANVNFQHDGALDASGGGSGGEIDVAAGTDATLNGAIDISGRALGSGGGTASIEAGDQVGGALTINNLIDVSGGGCDSILGCGAGGSATLTGCNLTVTAAGNVLASAPTGGQNILTAREQMTINGKVNATTTTTPGTDGANTLVYPQRKPPTLAVNAVKPLPRLTARDTCTSANQLNCLVPCPTCGNGIVEFPETCDNDVVPAGTLPRSCDGCSAFCNIENCNDGLGCTIDSCDPVLGCRHVLAPAPCTEGPSPTPTQTPIVTLTPTVTVTPTTSPTPTITPTPTVTPTFTVTPTPTPADTATPTPALPGGCAATPVAGCRTPGISSLRLLDDPKGNNRLTWRWRGLGGLTSVADFGDPVQGAAGYRLCVYDDTAGVPILKLGARAPAAGLCKLNKPCWKPTVTGYRYVDGDLSPDGLFNVFLTAGVMNKAKLFVAGRGPNLLMPIPAGSGLFKQDSAVTVQFVRSDGGPCWESVYPAPAKKNTLAVFNDTFP
jgi:hypothetical protein